MEAAVSPGASVAPGLMVGTEEAALERLEDPLAAISSADNKTEKR